MIVIELQNSLLLQFVKDLLVMAEKCKEKV